MSDNIDPASVKSIKDIKKHDHNIFVKGAFFVVGGAAIVIASIFLGSFYPVFGVVVGLPIHIYGCITMLRGVRHEQIDEQLEKETVQR